VARIGYLHMCIILRLGDRILGALVRPGTDVMIFKIFSPKNFAKSLAFLTRNKANFGKKLIIT
jgi:hypothetical protein